MASDLGVRTAPQQAALSLTASNEASEEIRDDGGRETNFTLHKSGAVTRDASSADKPIRLVQGDILALRTKKQGKQSGNKAGPELTGEFLDTIDNFAGIKNIDNFVLVSLKDRMYGFLPEQAVGVLQLQNKVDG